MFKIISKIFNRKIFKFNDLLSDKDVKSSINFKYTVYTNPYDIIRIELYYHSENGKYVSSVIRTDPSVNKQLSITNKEYNNFIEASKDFHCLCEKYHDDVYEGRLNNHE